MQRGEGRQVLDLLLDLGVTTVAASNVVPPCTTRCPTTAGGWSSKDGPTLPNASSIAWNPAAWSGTGAESFDEDSPVIAFVCFQAPADSPMRSTSPEASVRSSSSSMSWYLNELDPEFTTRAAVTSVVPFPFGLEARCAVVGRLTPLGGWPGQAGAAAVPAWMAVIATVLTMSLTSAPRERSLIGLRRPCSTGPIATAPADRCTAL